MAPRANWKGYLKLSLVSCAIALYLATSETTRVRFNTVNRKTGDRPRRGGPMSYSIPAAPQQVANCTRAPELCKLHFEFLVVVPSCYFTAVGLLTGIDQA
jgi:hypothetical protein